MKQPEDLESLRKEYCPPLDEALFFALALDFDISNETQATELRAALESLREGAIEEQELELLPPESSRNNAQTCHNVSTGDEAAPSSSHVTGDDAQTSITTGLSSLGVSDSTSQDLDGLITGYGEAGESFENLSPDEKVHWMMAMFPSVPKLTIEKILVKCNGEFDRSTDELLNETFFNDTGISVDTQEIPVIKGVEAFAIDDNGGLTKQKSKARKRRNRNRTDHDASPDLNIDSAHASGASTPDTNVWASAPRDIEFLTSRTELNAKTVASLYHANGARLGPTIRAILVEEAARQNIAARWLEEVVQWQIDELKTYFQEVPDDLIHASLILARRSPSAAKEILEAMMTSTEPPTNKGKMEGLATYAPLDLSEGESTTKTRRNAPRWKAMPAGGNHTVSYMSNPHGLAATSAFAQASAAHKRGKSDRLMGGAAAYYASVGHEHLRAARISQALEADAHVARQSSSNTLDLHGVNVSHAVRIAKDATETWWENLGDRKYIPSKGVGAGYKIVTGVGRHSSDGIGRIGPAVSKMLVREGWKVEVDQGQVMVLGRARKK